MRAGESECLRKLCYCKWLFYKERQRGYWVQRSRGRVGAAVQKPLNSASQVPIYGSAAVKRSEWRNMFYRLNILMALWSTAAREDGAALPSRDPVWRTRARDSGRSREWLNVHAYLCHR
jgi:hypothetical protein